MGVTCVGARAGALLSPMSARLFLLLCLIPLSGCLATAAIGAAGAVTGAVVGTAVKTTGAVVDAVVPDDDEDDEDDEQKAH